VTDKKKIDELINVRIDKLNNLKDSGIEPYPHSYSATKSIKEIKDNEDQLIKDNETLSACGRIVSIRQLGKILFINIQSDFDRLQCYISNKNMHLDEEQYKTLINNIDIGDIVGIKGQMFYTKTNEYTLKCDVFTLLSKSIRPLPNLKQKEGESFNAFDDKELRYRNRHLDFIANPENKEIFVLRHQIINSFRDFLNKKSFIEAETPVLQPIYGGANARPFTTHHHTLNEKLYLRIAVELYLKRLIIGGFDKVYEISKNFRNEGMDRSHNPEFTMLEFYQSYSDVYGVMDLTENMIRSVANTISTSTISYDGNTIDFSKPFRQITLNELFEKEFKIKNLLSNEIKLREISSSLNLDEGYDMGKIIDKIFSLKIEPKLIQPTFVLDYPKILSPLSKIKRDQENDIVERFELFIGGMEIANAFSELNDPIDQRERFTAQEKLKDKGDEEAQVLDENFLEAIESGMPPTGGVGIGIDRVVMILTGNTSIKDVILFPAMRNLSS
tara:strand:+ start:42792 stop:44291 length:1500 start_codon:yes stop_codon:yes gene_type:complete